PMADRHFNHEGTQIIRAHWFDYLDAVEPLRGELHAYCLGLTGNIWDAEDLVQDTLLKGFGMAARGDFHGENSPVRNVKAYLFRTATNAWLDFHRRRRHEDGKTAEEPETVDTDPVEVSAAVDKALALTSPQEFAALLLKDVYDFTLEEVADFIGTTTGTVKSALSRGRRKMKRESVNAVDSAERRELVERFVDAINSQDVDRVIELMTETVQISVCNVGGGRGRDGIWSKKSLAGTTAKLGECDGRVVVLMFRDAARKKLWDVLCLEGDGQIVTRIVDYCYAPETLRYVADRLDLDCAATAYHQPRDTIETDMIPTTRLPWRE
ncbi:MAG: sigma-70 family RNA polymerase sigma factor, partial [Pseudomonadales bacterium]|nr:sigma-70 family RNA polymerase sigma factor [Pseudomonadales bacterium]